MENNIKTFNVKDVELKIKDTEKSETLNWIIDEIFTKDEYGINELIQKNDFKDSDIILDIGANVGVVSIFFAKKYPNIKIYAYEASPINYKNLLYNIKINNTNNIFPFNKAVFSESNIFLELCQVEENSGGTSSFLKNSGDIYKVPTISLDDIIANLGIKNIKFLKMDCEGCEFQTLENSKLLKDINIEHIGIEIHSNYNKNTQNLVNLINKLPINTKKIRIF